MKRGFIFGLTVMLAVLMLMGFTDAPEQDAEPTATPTIEVVEIAIIPTPVPPPVATIEPDTREIVITDHAISASDIEIIARLLWSSPLRNKTAKAALVWVVLNRCDSDRFDGTIAENVNTTEFAFYDKRAHVSNENMEIARIVINQWMSEKDGNHSGRLVAGNGLFISFGGDRNRTLTVLDDRGGNKVTYPMRGAYDYE